MIVFGLALQALSVSLYVFTRDLASFYGLALMFGFSYGAVMPLYAILVREYFGAPIMGMMFSAVNVASTLGMAIGPWTGGWLYDACGSYFWLLHRLLRHRPRSHRPRLPPAPRALAGAAGPERHATRTENLCINQSSNLCNSIS
jgi:MFS family permease